MQPPFRFLFETNPHEPTNSMRNRPFFFIAPLLAACVMTPLLSGCGGKGDSTVANPSDKDISISLLADGSVRLELVKLPNGMWFGKTEVTQAQWEAVAGENPSYYPDRDLPVIDVTWDDCQMFLRRLNALPEIKRTGLVFRLPTSEEWTYACRAGAENDFCRLSDGKDVTPETLGRVAWFKANNDDNKFGNKAPRPVGGKEPNAFGLFDMLGNVREWCQDEVVQMDPSSTGERYAHMHVFLGGGCCNSVCTASNWDFAKDGDDIGFRVCAASAE